MTETVVQTDRPTPTPRRLRWIAIIASLVAVLSALAIPFAPVRQQQASISWPQTGTELNVDAPLVAYAPIDLHTTVPRTAIDEVAARGGGLVLGTIPESSSDATKYGLMVKVTEPREEAGQAAEPARLEVTLRKRTLLTRPVAEAADLRIDSDAQQTTLDVGGNTAVFTGDLRPQLVGIYSDLDGPAPAGMSMQVQVDSRFSSSPSVQKWIAMVLAVLGTAVALGAVYRMDRSVDPERRPWLPQHWWRPKPLDGFVASALVLWHFIGAQTSDDGYQFTLARASQASGYMANYFRWYGVPEAPFGTPYYDLLSLLSRVTTASPFMRLPALVAGLVSWWLLSRVVAPRLGAAVSNSRLVLWTGAFVFLAFWLPYNNGLRPEPMVAFGVLVTWTAVEHGIATRRMLPFAGAIIAAAVTLTVGPSGVICFAALLAGARPFIGVLVERVRRAGVLATVGPLLASGVLILVAAFGDQTLAAVRTMQTVHAIGPKQAWFEEYLRYQWLFQISADGSVVRRFGVLMMILALAVVIPVMLRRGHIPGTLQGSTVRLLGTTLGALLLIALTPTKWTHHFGVFATLGASVAMVLAVAVSPAVLRSKRYRALFASVLLFFVAITFTTSNSWWYVSGYSVPWWDKPVSVSGVGAGTVLLALAGLTFLFAGYQFLREPYERADRRAVAEHPSTLRERLWAFPVLTAVAGVMVAFMFGSMLKGAITQYPAFSLAKSNLGALKGNACGLAGDVLAETDPNASVLTPIGASAAAALSAGGVDGFTPNGVASDLRSDEEAETSGMANAVADSSTNTANSAGTGGGTGAEGLGGSTVALPFGLDPARIPVLGSYGTNTPASLQTGWYSLDRSAGPLVSVAVAGRVHSVDKDGIVTDGASVVLQYGHREADGSITALGSADPIDIGPAPAWRNLRYPLDAVDPAADAVRLMVDDPQTESDRWVAVTPPRVPRTTSLNELVGSAAPVMLDWEVGLQFPCQRPFEHRTGIAEVPQYRIMPSRQDTPMTTAWSNHDGGGPLGWIDLVTSAQTIPTYLRDDWSRDWGALERFTPLVGEASPAQVDVQTMRRSGMWTPGPINTGW